MVDIKGDPWFVAADVCEALGLKRNPQNRSYQNHNRKLANRELSPDALSRWSATLP